MLEISGFKLQKQCHPSEIEVETGAESLTLSTLPRPAPTIPEGPGQVMRPLAKRGDGRRTARRNLILRSLSKLRLVRIEVIILCLEI